MRNIIIFLGIVSLTICLREVPQDYTLIFKEDFSSIEKLQQNWNFEIGNGVNGWGNWEKQYYRTSEENVFVKDNQLHIKALNKNIQNYKYTSARLTTKNTFEFAYGYVKTRIKLPKVLGSWPAFWMLGQNFEEIGWPKCGEIDIVESVNDNDIIKSYLHWFDDGTGKGGDHGSNTQIQNKDQFHIYEMFWDKSYIKVFIDGTQNFIIDIANIHTNAFTKQFYFLINIAVGGTLPGNQIDNSKFPLEMIVDYIEVYQKNNELNYKYNPKSLIYNQQNQKITLNDGRLYYPFFKYGELRMKLAFPRVKGYTSKVYLFNRDRYSKKGDTIIIDTEGNYGEIAFAFIKDDSNTITSGTKWKEGDSYSLVEIDDVTQLNEYLFLWNEKSIKIYVNDIETYKIDITSKPDLKQYYIFNAFIEQNSNNNNNAPEIVLQNLKLFQYVKDTIDSVPEIPDIPEVNGAKLMGYIWLLFLLLFI